MTTGVQGQAVENTHVSTMLYLYYFSIQSISNVLLEIDFLTCLTAKVLWEFTSQLIISQRARILRLRWGRVRPSLSCHRFIAISLFCNHLLELGRKSCPCGDWNETSVEQQLGDLCAPWSGRG